MSDDRTLTGIVLEEQYEFTLDELARMCSCRVEWLIELVDEGIIEPQGGEPDEWRFTGVSLVRVQTAMRLHHDLDVNLAGVALAIDLIDEINELQALLRVLETR